MPSKPLRALLAAAPQLLKALDEALAAGGQGQPGIIPAVQGLTSCAVARLAYRLWLEEAPSWGPLVQLDPRHLTGDSVWGALTEALEQADRGWLFLAPGWQDAGTADELLAESGKRVRLLVSDEGSECVAPASTVRRLERLDRFHLVASDPSLTAIRQALIAHCRARAVLHLMGPPGTGKKSLVCWAHALLDSRPLRRVRPGFPDKPEPGGWQLYQEVGQLAPSQLACLRERLQEDAVEAGLSVWGASAAERPGQAAFAALLGDSPGFLRALDRAARFAASDLPMLISGATGTGRTILAQTVHSVSGRSGPLLTVDLHIREPEQLEAELFGEAQDEASGALAKARAGTLVLDGLEFLPTRLQARLLRLLDARSAGVDSEVRLLAIAGADLESMVRSGEFRKDLLARFHPAARVALPGLRERPEDVPLLLEHFAGSFDPRPRFSEDACLTLAGWSWPGNVRELRQLVEAAACGSDREIGVAELETLLPGSQPGPMIATSTQASEDRRCWPLPRSEVQRLTAVTLQVPGLAERGAAAVRHAILSLVDGRPVPSELLRVLESGALWGNYSELKGCLDTASGGPAGALDVPTELFADHDRAPIRVLLFPAVHRGRVAGMERSFPERGIVLGRIASLQELEAAGPQTQLSRRGRVIASLLAGSPAGCLSLGFLSRLSRAHCLVVRDGGELLVHLLPGAGLPVLAGSLEGGAVFEVGPEEPVAIGRGGTIQVLDKPGGAVYLELFLFVGAAAFDDLEPLLAARLQKPVMRTLGVPARRMRSWVLNGKERSALVEVVFEAARSPHPFATCLRKTARRWQEWDPPLARLAHYLDSAHPSQSCARLLAAKGNEVACAALAELLGKAGAARETWLKLPAGIQKLVPSPPR